MTEPYGDDLIWRHKKRGTTYRVLTYVASLQCASAQEVEAMFEDDSFVVYQNTETGAIYVRPYPEFTDGRFEPVDGEFISRDEKQP